MDSFQRLLVALVLAFACASAHAGYAQLSPPQGLGFDPEVGYHWRGTGAANGSWGGTGYVNYAGKRIGLQGTWNVAANASTFARNALRFNPWTFAATAALALALDAGIDWNETAERWEKQGAYTGESSSGYTAPLSGRYWHMSVNMGQGCYLSSHNCTFQQVIDKMKVGVDDSYHNNQFISSITHESGSQYRVVIGAYWCCGASSSGIQYYTRYIYADGARPVPTPVEATDADWLTVPNRPVTDEEWDIISQYFPGDYGMPVQAPEWVPATEPLGAPYPDPITGVPYRDYVRVSPDPLPESPFRVRLDPIRQPVDQTTPDPVNDPQPDPNQPPEALDPELPAFCDWATTVCDFFVWFQEESPPPESIPVPELSSDAPGIENFGLPSSGSCPQPYQLNLTFGGSSHVFSVPFDAMCTFAGYARPLVLASAYLAAGLLLLGVRR